MPTKCNEAVRSFLEVVEGATMVAFGAREQRPRTPKTHGATTSRALVLDLPGNSTLLTSVSLVALGKASLILLRGAAESLDKCITCGGSFCQIRYSYMYI